MDMNKKIKIDLDNRSKNGPPKCSPYRENECAFYVSHNYYKSPNLLKLTFRRFNMTVCIKSSMLWVCPYFLIANFTFILHACDKVRIIFCSSMENTSKDGEFGFYCEATQTFYAFPDLESFTEFFHWLQDQSKQDQSTHAPSAPDLSSTGIDLSSSTSPWTNPALPQAELSSPQRQENSTW